MNKNIRKDVANLSMLNYKASFQSNCPMLKVSDNQANPFIPKNKNYFQIFDEKEKKSTHLYSEKQLHITTIIDCDNENVKNEEKDEKRSENSQKTASNLQSCSIEQLHDMHLSLKLANFSAKFSFVEPIHCSVFLYSEEKQKIISDSWNFTIPQDGSEEKEIEASFMINNNQYSSTYLILILSHPLTVQNSSNIIKYYQNPTDSNLQAAKKNLSASYPRLNNIFSQFCWTFIELGSLSCADSITANNFYLLEYPVNEALISERLMAPQLKSKHLDISLIFTKTKKTGNEIRLLPCFNLLPYLYPIHQLSLRINSADIHYNEARNILILVNLRNSTSSDTLKSIFNPYEDCLTNIGFSSCVYHNKSPVFNDNFIINLPFPIDPSTVLCFDVIHVHAKESAKDTFTQIGRGFLNIFDNSGLIRTYDDEEVPISFLEKEEVSDSSIRVSVSLRSTISTDNEALVNLRETKDFDKYLSQIPDSLVISNLMEILDLFVELFSKDKCSFDVLFTIKSAAERLRISEELFSRYLKIYASYFSIRGDPPVRGFHRVKKVSSRDAFDLFEPQAEEKIKAKPNHVKSVSYASSSSCLITPNIANDPSLSSFKSIDTRSRKTLHTKLIKALLEYLNSNSINRVSVFIDFIFILLTKSMIITPFVSFECFEALCEAFSLQASKEGELKLCDSFGVFVLMLFYIGFGEESYKATTIMINILLDNKNYALLDKFLSSVIQPIPFLMWTKYSPEFRESMIKVIKSAAEGKKTSIAVVERIIQCSSLYTHAMNSIIASNMIDALAEIKIVDIYLVDQTQPLLEMLLFIISNASKQALERIGSRTLISFASYVLTNSKLEPKKLHSSIIRFIIKTIQITGKESVDEMLELVYHLLFLMPDDSLLSYLCSMISILIKTFIPCLFYSIRPPLAKIFYQMLRIGESKASNDKKAKIIAKPFFSLFDAEYEKEKSNNVSIIIAIRAISLLRDEDYVDKNMILLFEAINESDNDNLKKFVALYRLLRDNSFALLKQNKVDDKTCSLLFTRFKLFRRCPDLQLKILNEIAEFNLKKNNKMEYVTTLLLKAALILEYSCISGTIPNVFSLEHCSSVFMKICPLACLCQSSNMILRIPPAMQVFATGSEFTQIGYIDTLQTIINYCLNEKMFNMATSMVDFLWPVLEYNRFYNECTNVFSTVAQIVEEAKKNPPENSEIMQEHYFRVALMGEIFGEENGKEFVYHTNRVTRVFDVSNQIINEYNEVYDGKIQNYQAAGGKIDPSYGYIDVTFIEPYKTQEIDSIGAVHLANRFYFDTPFVPGSNKPQGTVETQWLRRTIIETAIALPCLLHRVETIPTKKRIKNFEPIEVAYKQIKSRTKLIEDAINSNDYRSIQQLLHGSLLVQVNEGPAKMAEVFLTKEDKRNEKLKEAFNLFIEANEKGVKKHGEWTEKNPTFEALQTELESGLESLKEKIQKLC